MPKSILRPALILGLMSCIGPFAIDMYLPAMPDIGVHLGASVQAMQGTITAYFLAFGLGQLLYGPWADQAGRKPPLYAGIVVFCIGAAICAWAPTVEALTLGRAVQGFGGAALMVVPRAIIRDGFTGNEATRLMAAIMLVFSVSPMLAPLAGSGLLLISTWRMIFGVLLIAALLSLLLLRFAQEETLPAAQRQRFHLGQTFAAAGKLMRDRGFVTLTFLGAFGMGSFFVFLAAASFVYTNTFGLSPTGFSLAFAANAIAFIGASQLAGPLGLRFGALRLMRIATAVFALATCIMFMLSITTGVTLAVCIIGLGIGNAGLGMVIPTAMVMALDDHGDIAGLASSLGGTLQMLTGGVIVALMGPFFSNDPAVMLGVIAICALAALLLSRLTRASRQAAAA